MKFYLKRNYPQLFDKLKDIRTDVLNRYPKLFKKLQEKRIAVRVFKMKLEHSVNPFKKSYSQYGEDKLIDKLLNYKTNGFYIDVGSNHPKIFNNTYRFYKKGWTGINIEPQTSFMPMYKKYRSRDITINCGISNKNTVKENFDLFIFQEDMLSTFSVEAKDAYINAGHQFLYTKKILINRLENIIEKYNVKSIDFMSIDVEGLELDVLDSFNFDHIKPKLIILESNGQIEGENMINMHMQYLNKYNYYLVYFNGTNSFLKLFEK